MRGPRQRLCGRGWPSIGRTWLDQRSSSHGWASGLLPCAGAGGHWEAEASSPSRRAWAAALQSASSWACWGVSKAGGRLGRLHSGTGVCGAGGLGRLRGAGGRGRGRLGWLGLTSGHGLPGKPSNEALLGTVVQLRPEGSKLGKSVVRRLGHWAENAGEGKEGRGLAEGLRKSAEYMDPARVT